MQEIWRFAAPQPCACVRRCGRTQRRRLFGHRAEWPIPMIWDEGADDGGTLRPTQGNGTCTVGLTGPTQRARTILTFILLFGVTSIVRWVIGPSLISRVIPHIDAEPLIVGAAVALLLAGLILSPPGRASGGHIILLSHLPCGASGCFPEPGWCRTPLPSCSVPSSACGRPCPVGPVVAEPPVVYAVLQPGPGGPTGICSRPRPSPWPSSCSSSGPVSRCPVWRRSCLGRRRPDRDGHRTARHVHRGQREPGPPVRPGCRTCNIRTSYRCIYSPRCWGAVIAAWLRQAIQHRRAVLTRQAMRHRNGRTPAVRCPGLPRNALPKGGTQRAVDNVHGAAARHWALQRR